MKRKFILPVICALILGYLCANYVLALYLEDSSSDNNTYFLQIAAYKNKESINDLEEIENKIVLEEDDKYYVYIGITNDIKIAKNIIKMYKDKNISLYIKEKNIDNTAFKLALEQYDVLLKNAHNIDEISAILKTVLATYEEEVLKR